MIMADVFDEISDDLRREKLNQFWKENGSWIIGGAVAAVLLTGILAYWRHWEYRHDAAATSKLIQLVTASNLKQLEDFANEGSKNHAMIARFTAAGTHLIRNEKKEAIALYDSIAGTSGIDKSWREMARVLSIGQRLDTGAPEVLEKELAELAADGKTWRYSAREMQALLAARQGQMQKAGDLLAKLAADPEAPENIRTRAFTLRELYMAEKTDPKS